MGPRTNGFKLYTIYKTLPEKIEEFGEILGYQVYHSTFNDAMYIVYNHHADNYYAFENESSTDIQADLAWTIKAHIVPLTNDR